MKSINTFADHAPKPEWVVSFFNKGDEFFADNTLGPMQIGMFKRFLSDSNLAKKNKVTPFYDLIKKVGTNTDAAWGLIYVQLAYNNPQIRWYIDNLSVDVPASRAELEERLQAVNVSEKDSKSIVKAFKRLVDIPLGTVLHFGTTAGKSLESITRTKCRVSDDRVLLYSLYRYAEACEGYYEFTTTRLMDTTAESTGISPVKLFGFKRDDLETMMSGLSAKYPEYINYTDTHGLEKVSLREDKTSEDVLKLFA